MGQSEDSIIKTETTTFSSDSQLLSELGERLIASKQVALSELIKNSYDADATRCNIWLEDDQEVLIVDDDGHGMTEHEFRNYWMTIATSNRGENPTSKKYNREVQGSKGVGRFAVRNLGLYLELRTVAFDEEAGEYRRLVAEFDWEEFESGSGLRQMDVRYRIESDATEEDVGTRLEISDLRENWDSGELEEVSGEVLDIVSAPYEPNPSEIEGDSEEDPGFAVYFAEPGEGSPAKSIASEIYDRYVAKVEISVDGDTLTYRYDYEGSDERVYKYNLSEEDPRGENLVGDISGEIRFLPNRKGVLRGMKTTNGTQARSWLNENGGVRVVDNNFRMPPYGDPGNDWLGLSEAQARRSRNWESDITEALLPEEDREVSESKAMLRLPRKRQVLGSVNVSSYRPGEQVGSVPNNRLVPNMDRQGFVENQAYEQLVDIVRGSLEILGLIDELEQKQKSEEKAEENAKKAKSSVEEAKESIKDSDNIPAETKQEVIETLDEAEESIEDQEEAEREAREAVESMNLLGVVSAFMSHETSLIVDSANEMLTEWRKTPSENRTEEFQERIDITEEALEDFETHQSYAQSIMDQLADGNRTSFPAADQVDQVISTFRSYTSKRSIRPINDVDSDIETPKLNVGLYVGVLTNLYTNAMKAVLEEGVGEEGRLIRFTAENSEEWHKIRVMDNGSGMTEEEKTRIFEPWFSESKVEGPLGIGHGLGLYIVDKVVGEVDGEIELVEPPKDFETAFEVRYPR